MSDQSQPNLDTLELLELILAAFNRHDIDAILSCFADNAVMEMPRGTDPWGARHQGKDAIRAALISRFAGIPDVQYSEDLHWTSGDRGVSEWLLTGTTATGDTVQVRGCDLWTFRDGLVVRKDSYWKLVE